MQVGYDAIVTEQCCIFSVTLKIYQWAIASELRTSGVTRRQVSPQRKKS
jgi:hypothetical protein